MNALHLPKRVPPLIQVGSWVKLREADKPPVLALVARTGDAQVLALVVFDEARVIFYPTVPVRKVPDYPFWWEPCSEESG